MHTGYETITKQASPQFYTESMFDDVAGWMKRVCFATELYGYMHGISSPLGFGFQEKGSVELRTTTMEWMLTLYTYVDVPPPSPCILLLLLLKREKGNVDVGLTCLNYKYNDNLTA